MVNDLIASEVISDAGMLYFDVRPSAHLPTLEMRISDACPDVDDAVMLAGLFRALVRQQAAPHPFRPPSTEFRRSPVASGNLAGCSVRHGGGTAGSAPQPPARTRRAGSKRCAGRAATVPRGNRRLAAGVRPRGTRSGTRYVGCTATTCLPATRTAGGCRGHAAGGDWAATFEDRDGPVPRCSRQLHGGRGRGLSPPATPRPTSASSSRRSPEYRSPSCDTGRSSATRSNAPPASRSESVPTPEPGCFRSTSSRGWCPPTSGRS